MPLAHSAALRAPRLKYIIMHHISIPKLLVHPSIFPVTAQVFSHLNNTYNVVYLPKDAAVILPEYFSDPQCALQNRHCNIKHRLPVCFMMSENNTSFTH